MKLEQDIKRTVKKGILTYLLAMIPAIGIYLYFARRIEISEGIYMVQIIGLGVLILINVIYCFVVMKRSFPILAQPMLMSAVLIQVYVMQWKTQVGPNLKMLLLLVVWTGLSATIYLVTRRKFGDHVINTERKGFNVKQEIMTGLLWWSFGIIAVLTFLYFGRNARVDFRFLEVLVLTFLIGMNLI
ncbi:MAG: hypothetical protein ACRD63_10160, partial [Pyrinomonadaceae bacterium]